MRCLTSYIALGILLTINFTSHSTPRLISSEQPGQIFSSSTGPGISDKLDTGNISLSREIASILDDTSLASCFIGAEIVSLEDGKILFERNSHKLFHPASNMKLLTSSTALNLLPDSFRFTTKIYAGGKINDGTLHGNLNVKGTGDPLLTTADLDSMATTLRRAGIKSITGNLVGDVSYFDSIYWGHGWMWDDEPNSDEAFISALSVNDNSIRLDIQPGKNIGSHPTVTLDPPTGYVKFVNGAVTSFDTMIAPLSTSRPSGTNTITLRGRITPGSGNQTIDVSISKPEMYFLYLLRERLSTHGIKVLGHLRVKIFHDGSEACRCSHIIDSVLWRLNKNSDNIAAENLLKTLAAEKHGIPGSTVDGLNLIKGYLVNEGIDTTDMILADGSGVSWYNAITPAAIVQLLQRQYQRHRTFERFYRSLSIAGIDGTLRNRMHGTYAGGNVHAKTGSLLGCSAISGYVTSADGKMIAFSIICNHFPGEISLLHEMQDRVLEKLSRMNLNRR